jgi:hypothetical protein
MPGTLTLMTLKSQQTSRDPTGQNHPNSALLSKDKQLETQTSYSVLSSLFQWKSYSRSKSVNSGLGVVVPIGLVGMVLRRGRKLNMLNGWDLGIRVRGERDLLGVDCDHDENESGERGTVTILMSHGYCIIFRCAAYD